MGYKILDTSISIDPPLDRDSFQESKVAIPIVLIDELDAKYKKPSEEELNWSIESVYKGWRELTVPQKDIDEFYRSGRLRPNEKMYINEFAFLKNEQNPKQTALAKFNGEVLIPLRNNRAKPWGIGAKNVHQQFLLEALLDPNIKLVTIMGSAGVGKSLVTIAAGVQQTIEDNIYEKMVIYKPVIPMGEDIGFLPGTEEDKLRPWMSSIYDSFEFIFNEHERKKTSIDAQIDYLKDKGQLELSALTFVRGRSRPNLFIFADECQNLSKHEVKTLISRCSEGTKVILAGDVSQIDNPFLNGYDNGLVHVIESFKGQEICAHVTLFKQERSPLAALAAELL